MYKIPKFAKSQITRNTSVQGEMIETKIERIISNKEPIKDGAPILYTARKDGVLASTNIRTDRFEIAVEAMDKVSKSYKARREERAKTAEDKKTEKTDKIGGAETIQGSAETPKK